MSKNTSCRNSILFVLNKIEPHCHVNNVSVSFSPLRKSNNLFESIAPRFNMDKNFFTPAFCLEGDQVSQKIIQEYYFSQPQFEREKFQEKVANAYEKKTSSSILMSSPQSSYCQVCRCSYQEYKTHINSTEHLKFSKVSCANVFIKDLCAYVRKLNKKVQPEKHKKIKKQLKCYEPTRKSKRLAETKNKNQQICKLKHKKSLSSIIQGISELGKLSEGKVSTIIGSSQAMNIKI